MTHRFTRIGGRRSLRDDWGSMPTYMKRMIQGASIVTGVFLISHIEKEPLTGRRRLMLISSQSLARMGEDTRKSILHQKSELPSSHPMTRAVLKVGESIKAQCVDPAVSWKFHVIDDPEPNAFCLPGGTVFVHSGLFKILQNEDALAAVLFHEAAHGLLRHGGEKLSFVMLIYGLLMLLAPDAGHFGQLIIEFSMNRPFSRKLEFEADSIGLRLMAKACYDPRASLRVQTALGNNGDKAQSLFSKYLSTHPPSAERVDALRGMLREAMDIYKKSDCSNQMSAYRRIREF